MLRFNADLLAFLHKFACMALFVAESKDATAMPAATTGAAAAATAISAVTTGAAAAPAASKAPVPPPKVAGPVMNAAVLSELRKTMKRPPAHEVISTCCS